MKTTIKLLSIVLMLTFFMSCSNDDEVTPDLFSELVLLETAAVPDTDLTVKIFTESKTGMYVGYNAYQVGLFDTSGVLISNSDISVMPMMKMMEMNHSAPHEQHAYTGAANELHSFGTVFQMPSDAMQTWSLEIAVNDKDRAIEGSVSVNCPVTVPQEERMKSFVTSDETKLFVSLLDDVAPQVGTNDFEITIHKKMGMMDWPAVENYTIEIEPEMPAMGHGSPNNVNPVHTQKGHYMGKVNFTMTGYWKINISIYDGTDLIQQTSFDITF